MNRNDFTGIIHNTSLIDRQIMGEVRELVDIFPYFQSAHLLLLKGLHNISDVKFENQLRQSAIHIADREVLYYLLNRESRQPVEQSEPVDMVIDKESITPEIVAQINVAGTQASHTISEASEEDDSGRIVFLMEDDADPVEEKVFFLDPSMSVPWHGDLLELDLPEQASDDQGKGSVSHEEKMADENNSRKKIQAELIERFIIANPRIEPVRDKTFQPVEDISKPFTEETGGFITETLAKIYITQGYYSKAIDIYEKLSLKFPEKSSYFATQIEKVRDLIK
jgi:hypothetical protein